MPTEWRYRGRAVSAEDIAFIRQLIAAHPGASRRALSAKLCEAWGWKQANGAPRDMVCRGLLLMLDRAGETPDGVPGLVFGAAAPGQPGPLHRLERRSPATQHPLPRLQHPLSDSALGSGRALGLPHPGSHGEAVVRGLGAVLRTPDLL